MPRPTIIATNGYDSTAQEMHFGHAVAAVRRGYNCLTFDGPGQGRMLFKQRIHMRPDWENVIRPVVDDILTRPEVDQRRIALIGWSFGGYLAPRAASGEHRLAACIGDPGQWDLLDAMKDFFSALPPEALENPTEADPALFRPYLHKIEASLSLRWTFVQRCFWVHGVNSLPEYLRLARNFSLKGVADRIECPTLVTQVESDPVAKFAEQLHAALRCPKKLVRFANIDGAGDHCEARARTLFHQCAFDWLDEIFNVV